MVRPSFWMLGGMRGCIASADNLEQCFSSICNGMTHMGEEEDNSKNSRNTRETPGLAEEHQRNKAEGVR